MVLQTGSTGVQEELCDGVEGYTRYTGNQSLRRSLNKHGKNQSLLIPGQPVHISNVYRLPSKVKFNAFLPLYVCSRIAVLW